MLSLQLNSGEYIMIGDDIVVQVFREPEGRFRVCVDAPRAIPVMRGELLERDGKRRPGCVLPGRPGTLKTDIKK